VRSAAAPLEDAISEVKPITDLHPPGADHHSTETHGRVVSADPSPGDGVHSRTETPSQGDAISALCDNLRELHRQRQDLHRAEKSLTLQIKAKCRRICGGDKTEAGVLYKAMKGKAEHEMAAVAFAVSDPFVQARALLESKRKETEKAMDSAAKSLPIAPWVEGVRGMGMGSLAAIVGECGDLSNYSTVSKLWKRMGLAVVNGERQRRVAGAEAIEHGYSPSRRSVMWNVGQSILKAQSARIDKETAEVLRPAGVYREFYDAIKAIEIERVETAGHAHNRATRRMEKRVLQDLWVEWRRLGHAGSVSQSPSVEPSPSLSGGQTIADTQARRAATPS